MNEWIVGIILTVVQLVITTIVGLIVKRWWDKRVKDQNELEHLREVRRVEEENKRCQAVKDSLHQVIEPLQQDIDLMKRAMQKDVRRSLRQDGAMLKMRGYASHQEKTEFDELYWAYHNLGRNGVVDRLHEEVMALPDMPEGDR